MISAMFQNTLMIKIIVVIIFSVPFLLLLSKKSREFKSSNNFNSGMLYIWFFTVLFFVSSSFVNFSNWYKNIAVTLGFDSFENLIMVTLVVVLTINSIILTWKLILVEEKIKNLDQKYALEKNATEYKTKKDKTYRTGY